MATKRKFEQKNILVLGGAGFIGSHLCDELVKEHRVICVDNFTSGFQANIDHLLRNDNFVFIKEDINKLTDLEKYDELERFDISVQGVQEIYNLACPTSPKDFHDLKIETAKANSVGMVHSLELAVRYNAKYLLFSSSVVYGGRPADTPYMTEDVYQATAPLGPRASYDEGKRFAEALVDTYRDFHDIDAKIIRVFTTFGPRMPLFVGHMIPDFMVSAIDNEPLIIYGDENFTMTLCYVDDVIEAAVRMMASAESGPLNVGSPNEHKVSGIAQQIIEMTNSLSKITYEKELLFMKPLGVPDISRAKEKLDWFPVITLESGLEKTLEYIQAQKIVVNWGKQSPIVEE